MKQAVIFFTEKGRELAVRLDGDKYCYEKHCGGDAAAFTDIHALTADIFGRYDALVFVCATGIAVRAVAPHIKSKLTDPAVLVIDDSGRFVIPLLSGHIGGANALARKTAGIIGAVPVITTATDSHGLFSPDVFAKVNRLSICGISEAKAVAAAIVNGDSVGVKCAYPHSDIPAELTECGSGDIGICISGDPAEKPFGTTLNLIPKDLAVGIGCKRDTSCDGIISHVMSVFSANKLDIRRLSAVATIDIKSEEIGLKEFCERFSLPLVTFTAEELMNAAGDFVHSEFVEQTTGADNVCERAAVCAGGRIIVPKTAHNGVTAAIAELPVYMDFERGDDVCCT